MLRGLMLVEFECDVRLTFAATENFSFELLLVWDFTAIPTNQFRSQLEGGACLCHAVQHETAAARWR